MTGFENEVLEIIKEVEREEAMKIKERDEEIKEKFPLEMEERFLALIRSDMLSKKNFSEITYELKLRRHADENGYLTKHEYVGSFAGIEKCFPAKRGVEEDVKAFVEFIKEAFSSDVLQYEVKKHSFDVEQSRNYIEIRFILKFDKIKEKAKESH